MEIFVTIAFADNGKIKRTKKIKIENMPESLVDNPDAANRWALNKAMENAGK